MFKRYSFGWFMLALFLGSLLGQWLTHDGTATEFWNAARA